MRFSQRIDIERSETNSSLTAGSTNGISKILRAKMIVEEELKKSKNAEVVYQHFITRKEAIKGLRSLCECDKVEEHELKLLIYVCLFGYYNFLRRKTIFFANKGEEETIEGVTLK